MPVFRPGHIVALPLGVVIAARHTGGEARAPVLGGAEIEGPLGAALERAGLRTELSVPVRDLRATATAGTRAAVELTVPAPPVDEAQVVLEADDTGIVRWHFARPVTTTAARRSGAATQTFEIPVEQYAPPAPTAARRALLGFGLGKILHVLRFPVEWSAGGVARSVSALWERRHRPYGLWEAGPAYFEHAARPLDAGWFDGRTDPILLLVHGTFSTGYSGFAGLAADPAFQSRAQKRYGGAVLAFDHPTLHDDPAANVRRLLERLPAGRPLRFHVLGHSRGGLVARLLGDHGLAAAARRPPPLVERLIHVATPNAGTVLARPDRLRDLLDVATNMTALRLDDAAEPVLEIVKDVATGALAGLPGIAAMDPGGPWLAALNDEPRPAGVAVHAIAADFEPGDDAPPALKVLDGLADALFAGANDLVVPAEGVYRAGQYRVDAPLTLTGARPAVAHTGYFGNQQVRDVICGWLGA
ncbi:lipase family alpha/beta hydrolase [Dactylosporangium sp. McL0621]|uniref:lipase family alpha/beta hydrolase n=1 Tax=Dactylosporangium sp. McL0621 TaxID=3415678 RepID=UPI003CE6F7A7